MWINKGKKVPLMSFQGGGYIPGLSAARFRGGLGRDIRKTQEGIQSQAESLGKEQKQAGLWGKVGGVIGEYGLPALAQSLNLVAPGAGVVAGALMKGAGKGIGQYAGEKLAGLDDPTIKASSTGLLGGQFDLLQETQDKFKQGALGRSVKSGAGTALTSGLGDYAQAHMGSEIGKGLKGVGIDIGKAGPGQVMSQAGTPVGIPTADTGLATDYFKETLGFQEGGYAKEYQEGGNVPPKLTYGERFVKRFPSQHEDPERAAGQERGLTSLIDFLIPQSKLDIAMSAVPAGAFGKIGKKAMKKILKRTGEIPGKRSPYNEGRTNVDMQHYTDWPEEVKDEMLEEALSPKRPDLSDVYDEEGLPLDLVEILERQGFQHGGSVPMFNPMSSHGAIDGLMLMEKLK